MTTTLKTYIEQKKPIIEKNLKGFVDDLKGGKFVVPYSPSLIKNNRDFINCIKDILSGGKRIRPLMVYLVHELVGGSFKKIDDLAIVPELAHKGSVVIDDIEDGAKLRDNKLALYQKYGIPAAINCGNFLYFAPILILNKVGMAKNHLQFLLKSYMEAGLVAHIGQGTDIYWRDKKVVPSESEYLAMNAYKTSTFSFAMIVGALATGTDTKIIRILSKIGESIGIAYQLKDDILSLDERAHDFGEDIRQGKITLMLIRLIQQRNVNAKVIKKFFSAKNSQRIKMVQEMVSTIKNSGALIYTQKRANDIINESKKKIIRYFPHSKIRDMLCKLADYAVEREI
ncbi:MAG: polyprenyl synthetase family protein [Candidatus Kuenenbacteria bacterium]